MLILLLVHKPKSISFQTSVSLRGLPHAYAWVKASLTLSESNRSILHYLFVKSITVPFFFNSYTLQKKESIPGSRHWVHKKKKRQDVVPGRTYALNDKNSALCSEMFGSQSNYWCNFPNNLSMGPITNWLYKSL